MTTCFFFEEGVDALGTNLRDDAGAVLSLDPHPGLRTGEGHRSDVPVVERHCEKRDGLFFPGRQKLVDLARRRRVGDFVREPEESVGRLPHRGDDHDEVAAMFAVALHSFGDGLYVVRRRHRASAVFLDDDPDDALPPEDV